MTVKVLNLYAGIGGNRKLWENVDVTAVELNSEIANIYRDFFPNDKMIVGDAHEYLLKNFKEYDFIWSSPPCPTHSRLEKINGNKYIPRYPDMKLYEEIIFLQNFYKGKFCVENVIGYYKPLIQPVIIDKHYFWVNFTLNPSNLLESRCHHGGEDKLIKLKGFNISNYKGIDKIKTLRNCVEPKCGKYIFESAFLKKQEVLSCF